MRTLALCTIFLTLSAHSQVSKEQWHQVTENTFVDMKALHNSEGFRTLVLSNLPESYVVGAPESMINEVEGKCGDRTYHIWETWFYAGKNGSGATLESLPPEVIIRKVAPGSLFEKVFNLMCTTTP
jgi:hypothetical protein